MCELILDSHDGRDRPSSTGEKRPNTWHAGKGSVFMYFLRNYVFVLMWHLYLKKKSSYKWQIYILHELGLMINKNVAFKKWSKSVIDIETVK